MSWRNKQGQTRYNSEWERPELFPEVSKWILPVNAGNPDDVHYFSCKVCKSGKISLSNIGIGAVRNHMKDLNPVEKPNKHTKRMRDIQKNKKKILHTITICRLHNFLFHHPQTPILNHYQCYPCRCSQK